MIGIYKITNLINNKCYVGQSTNIERRLINHKNMLKYDNHKNIHLQRSVNKYGLENFSFDIIETLNEENYDLLNEKEIFYIKEYKSMYNENGYNIECGGLNCKKSIESIKRATESRSKLFDDPNYIKKISNIHKQIYVNNPELGKEISNRNKLRMLDVNFVNNHKLKTIEAMNKQEVREKISSGVQEALKNSDMLENIKKSHNTKEYKEKQTQIQKELWGENSELRNKMIQHHNTQEYKDAQSKLLKEKLNTKEYKDKVSDSTIYTFKNINTEEIFVGKRYEFQEKYSLLKSGVWKLLNNYVKQYKGWIEIK